jgi:hypothetical protein
MSSTPPRPAPAPTPARTLLLSLAALSAVLLAVRALAAARLGFGDSEALYASYALHPQPAYLDHPGLVGVVARALGGGTSPSPARAHAVTALLATLWPWTMAAACRAAGATWARALAAALVVSVVPEMAVGLFALTPDLLLAFAWTGAIALAAVALRGAPGSARATAAFAAAGLLAGAGASAKATGALLIVALPAAYASRPARAHARTLGPWAGLAAGLLAVAPVVQYEARSGWPMLRHRLVDTQAAAGPSLRNLGALVGGQIVYLSPVVVVLAALAAREAWRARGDAVGRLLLASFLVPIGPLTLLCLWSRVAEPHWIAPALLALVPAAARADVAPPRRWLVGAGAVGAILVAAVHAWALVPAAVRLAPASYDPRLDLTNELAGWPEVVRAVRAEAADAWSPGAARGDVAVAGPHWVICAQLEAALRGAWPVGCDTPVRDDFDDWWPRSAWREADAIVWVSDTRFEPWTDARSYAPLLSSHVPLHEREIRIERDGRTVRVFTVTLLGRRAGA